MERTESLSTSVVLGTDYAVMPCVRGCSYGTKKGVKRVHDLSVPASDNTVDVSPTPVCKSRKRASCPDRLPRSISSPSRECFQVGKGRTKDNKREGSNEKNIWLSSLLVRRPKSVSPSFSSRCVRVAGYVDDHANDVTIDTTTGVSIVSLY